ncbi:hypothetical protein JTB14_027185 [Gonioctena quinquepunctata]|nr:hypothetical protein JTB14_027185 [Gonioctena quinquepunctata]
MRKNNVLKMAMQNIENKEFRYVQKKFQIAIIWIRDVILNKYVELVKSSEIWGNKYDEIVNQLELLGPRIFGKYLTYSSRIRKIHEEAVGFLQSRSYEGEAPDISGKSTGFAVLPPFEMENTGKKALVNIQWKRLKT